MKIKQQFKLRSWLFLAVLGIGLVFTACDEDDPDPQSAENSITSFIFDGLTPPAGGVISGTTIAVDVANGTDVTALAPTIVISAEATVDPASGVAQDFSSPVTYTVTAEDGTAQAYIVTVTVAQSDATEMLSFAFEGLTPTAQGDISGTDVSVIVPEDTDLTALVPTIMVSGGATVSPESGIAQDFSSDVEYVVTAQDGTTTATYTVNVVVPSVNIMPVWEKTLANGGVPSWFTADNDRDVALSTDYVYVHNNADKIRVMSLADGSDVAVRDTADFIDGKENFESGTFRLSAIYLDSQDKIVGSNLRIGDANEFPWNVYKWDDKDASQELLFSYPTPAGYRLGDNILVNGDVTADAAIFAPAVGSNDILKFNITGGVPDTEPQIISLIDLPAVGNAADVELLGDINSNLLVAGTGIGGIAEYDQTGALVARLDSAVLNADPITAPLVTFALDVKPFEISGRKLIATTATDFTDNAADDGYLYIIDYTDGLANVTVDDVTRVALTPDGNIDKNINGTGGVDVTIDGNTATVAAMITNFGVGLYTVTYE